MVFLREFISECNRPCKICKYSAPKLIRVRTFWKDEARSIALTDNFLSFRIYGKITDPVAYQTFKLHLDSHKFEKETYNPANEDLLFANNFSIRMTCNRCNSYSVQSSNFSTFEYNATTTSINVIKEIFELDDGYNIFELTHYILTGKIVLQCRNHSELKYKNIDLPESITINDFPFGNKSKAIKKIKTIMLLV